MRVLLVTGSFPPMKCGVGDYTALLAKSLAGQADVSVGVLTSFGAQGSIAAGAEVFPVVRGWDVSDAPRIIATLRSWRPDIVHIQYPTLVYGKIQWVLPAMSRILNGPVVQTWHEYHPRGNFPNLLNAILPGGLIVVRPNYLENMPSWYRRSLVFKKILFIPNASSIPSFSLSEADRSKILSAWNIPSGKTVAFFGFASPAKGIDLLFRIADPDEHRLLLICDLDPSDAFHKTILEKAESPPWKGKVRVTGFLPADDAGRLLAAADAAVFPFLEGGGEWNTSLHGAAAQGTFVLTTSREKSGYAEDKNMYFAHPRNIEEMHAALKSHIGKRCGVKPPAHDWDVIADRHVRFYKSLVS